MTKEQCFVWGGSILSLWRKLASKLVLSKVLIWLQCRAQKLLKRNFIWSTKLPLKQNKWSYSFPDKRFLWSLKAIEKKVKSMKKVEIEIAGRFRGKCTVARRLIIRALRRILSQIIFCKRQKISGEALFHQWVKSIQNKNPRQWGELSWSRQSLIAAV